MPDLTARRPGAKVRTAARAAAFAAAAGLALAFAGPAQAQSLTQARDAILAEIDDDEDPYETLCQGGDPERSGYKALCRMQPPNAGFWIVGCWAAPGCAANLGEEWNIMRALNQGGVPSAGVSDRIDPMPCAEDPDDPNCQAFVEQNLATPGAVLWKAWDFIDGALEQAGLDTAACAQEAEAVFQALDTPVQNQIAQWQLGAAGEDAVSQSFQDISDFAAANFAWGDLQGFVSGTGFRVFDPDDRYPAGDFKDCFVNATAAVAEIAQPAMD